jgi:hypothetical protein
VKGLLAIAALALAAGTLDPSDFRWSRALTAPRGAGPIFFDADASLFAHGGSGFAGLRIVDAHGSQVPWRPLPGVTETQPKDVPLLDAGRQGGAAVALLDLGPHGGVHDRVDLDLPGQSFIGTATVSGSDDRGTFTTLGAARVFDLRDVRRTDVAFPPSDFRYLRLRVTGVTRIDGATVSDDHVANTARRIASGFAHGRFDLGGANVPVDAIRIVAAAATYDRPVRVEVRNPGGAWRTAAVGRIYRLYGTPSPPIELGAAARYLRVVVHNGDDQPLKGLRITLLAKPRRILVEGGHSEPLRVLYGGRVRSAPDYEFARLPRDELALANARLGHLTAPAANPSYVAAPDTRTWVKRHGVVVDAALALAAAVVGLGGFLALRRRA